MDHDITTNHVTVWINGDGGLLGRFGPQGVDIHRPISEQLTGGECLFCTHGRTTEADWRTFVEKMKEHFGIEVSDDYKPIRFILKDLAKTGRARSDGPNASNSPRFEEE